MKEFESRAAEHLALEHLDSVDTALHDAGVPGRREAGDDGVEVAFEVLGEPAQAGQVGGCAGGLDPLRQSLALQLGDHVGEGADVLGECCHLRAVG